MLSALTETQRLAADLAAVPAIFIVLLAAGRLLKRRHHVHLGTSYLLFSVVLAFYLPLHFARAPIPYRAELLRHAGSAALVLGALVGISLVRRFFWELWYEKHKHAKAPKFASQLIELLICLAAVVLVLTVGYGQTVPGLLAGSGIAAIVLGLALQDLLGNIIAGIALEIGKPFKVGDWLVVEGTHAEVMEVNWRSTRLRDNDDICRDIPNKQIVGGTIINLTYPTRQHAIRLTVGFDYNVPPNFIKDVMARAAGEVKGVLLTPPPRVFLKDFGDSAVMYEIKFYMEDESNFNDIVDGIRTNVWYAAQRQGIRIPFPIRTLQIERPGTKPQDSLAPARTAIRKQPFFQLLDAAQVDRLLSAARLLRFGRGEKVIQQGAIGGSMFIMLSGEAEVFVNANGQEALVATLRPGDYCGEMSLLTGEPRSATVIARADCEMWKIDKAVLAEILQENSALVEKLSEQLAQRRLATEGILASTADDAQAMTKQKEYTAGFLKKLYSFFEL